MADRSTLTTPRLQVVLDDGATHDVQTDNRDLLAWDRTRAKHKWPAATDAPFVWMTFLAWHALRREGATTLQLAEFEDHCLSVSTDQEPEQTDPTNPAAEPDS